MAVVQPKACKRFLNKMFSLKYVVIYVYIYILSKWNNNKIKTHA